MSPDETNDRDWLAMQYVLGELSDPEQRAFEERLPNDLELCEAVTAASRLIQTAHTALATSSAQPTLTVPVSVQNDSQRQPRHSLLAVIVASAAMALALLLVVRLPEGRRDISPLASNQDPQAAELVSLWQSGSDADDDDSDEADEATDSGADIAVPSWMLAALSIEAGDAINGPSDKVQEN